MSTLHAIEVEIHMPVNDGFRVKVAVEDLGMYLNGVLVFPPNDKHDAWIVYPPSTKVGARWIYMVEFNKKETLWREIVEACEAAVKASDAYRRQYPRNDFTSDIEGIEEWDDDRFRQELEKRVGDDGSVRA